MEDINIHKPRFHFFICTNDRDNTPDTLPSCGPRISKKEVTEIKQWIMANGWTHEVFCTTTGCLGFCNAESSVLAIYPEGRFIKGIKNIEDIKRIIKEEVSK